MAKNLIRKSNSVNQGRSFTSLQMFHTHTHLLRTIFANSDVECILRAKTLQLYLTGMGWWKDPRMNEKKLSPKSMLDEISWQIATTVRKLWNLQNRHAGSGLSRLPLTRNEKWCRYADWRPNLYHQIKWVSSLVAVPDDLPLPPALKWILKLKPAVEVDKVSRRENRNPNEQQKTTSSGRSFTSVQMFHTHALLPQGFFLKMHNCNVKELWYGQLGSDRVIKRPETRSWSAMNLY